MSSKLTKEVLEEVQAKIEETRRRNFTNLVLGQNDELLERAKRLAKLSKSKKMTSKWENND